MSVTVDVESLRASERAYRVLLDEIQCGALKPGAVLGEVEQSTRLGISRTPVREALARLTADGLVVQQSARVTIVSALDADRVRALFEVRRMVEVEAARIAARRGSSRDFAELAAAFGLVTLTAPDGRAAYDTLLQRFDDTIDAALDNDYLVSMLRQTRTHLVRVRRFARENTDRLAASVAEHALIAEAIADGDVDLAAHATHIHIHNALRAVLATLGAEDREGAA